VLHFEAVSQVYGTEIDIFCWSYS